MSRHDERWIEQEAQHAEKSGFAPFEQSEDTRILPGMSPQEIELRIRRRVEIRRKQITGFVSHLISYLAVNAMLWIIFLSSTAGSSMMVSPSMIGSRTAAGASGFPWPIFVTLGWGIGLLAHAVQMYQNLPGVVAQRENALQREVARVKAQMGLSDSYGGYVSRDYGEKPKNTEKPKNDQGYNVPMQLTDDGEIVPAENESDLASDPRYMRNSRSGYTDR